MFALSRNERSTCKYAYGYGNFLVTLVIFVSLSCCDKVIRDSCLQVKLCCPGRDSSCVVQKTSTYSLSITQDSSEKPCYCDHACLRLGDCCADFKKTCNVVDCLVSAWHKWSECDTNCGAGIMLRKRTILKTPVNGGKRCPMLVQKRACQGTNCSQNPRSAFKEIAMLLPAKFSNKASEYENMKVAPSAISKNAYSLEDMSSSKKYCVLFHVLKAAKACRKEILFSNLQEGEKVCVHCDHEAMRPSLGYRCAGHGTMDRSTKWVALSAPSCHGKWVRLNSSPSIDVDADVSANDVPKKWSVCRSQCPDGPQILPYGGESDDFLSSANIRRTSQRGVLATFAFRKNFHFTSCIDNPRNVVLRRHPYTYQRDPLYKQELLKKLPGRTCHSCKPFYDHLKTYIPKCEVKNLKNAATRHRAQFKRSKSPQNIWKPTFSSFDDSMDSDSAKCLFVKR